MDHEKLSKNNPNPQPNTVPSMTTAQVIARAQRIVDLRGMPPFTVAHYGVMPLSEDEIALISEFVHYWAQYLHVKEKP